MKSKKCERKMFELGTDSFQYWDVEALCKL